MATRKQARLLENEDSRTSYIINVMNRAGIYKTLDPILRAAFIRVALTIYRDAHRAGKQGYESELMNRLMQLKPDEKPKKRSLMDRVLGKGK